MKAGIYWGVAGGTRAVIREMQLFAPPAVQTVFLTGGDAPLLEPALHSWLRAQKPPLELVIWPLMTLEGICLAAEALP